MAGRTTPGAGGPRLSVRALNRALLARQLLLRRHDQLAGAGQHHPSSQSETNRVRAPGDANRVVAAVELLVGLQAQAPRTPYVGLWSRLDRFDPAELSTLLPERRVVRIALMRSTIHLVSADDCLALRPLVAPALERSLRSNHLRYLSGVDLGEVATAGRALVEREPLTLAAIGAALALRWPAAEPGALAQAVRCRVPLVQVPPRGMWSRTGPVAHTTAEAWLSRPVDPAPSPDAMVLRYLAGYGPASVLDVQTWSGLTRLAEVVERLRPQLRVFQDEQGRELFDLPEAPRPEPDTPAPVRFLPEYDNALLSHADRSRIMATGLTLERFRDQGRLLGSVLVDGFVRGTWRIDRTRDQAIMVIEPLGRLSGAERTAVRQEAAHLLAFAEAEVDRYDVQISSPA